MAKAKEEKRCLREKPQLSCPTQRKTCSCAWEVALGSRYRRTSTQPAVMVSYVSASDFLGGLRPVTPVVALPLFPYQLQGWNQTMAPKLPPNSGTRDVRKPDGVGRIDLCDTRPPLQNENVGLRVQNLLRISRK